MKPKLVNLEESLEARYEEELAELSYEELHHIHDTLNYVISGQRVLEYSKIDRRELHASLEQEIIEEENRAEGYRSPGVTDTEILVDTLSQEERDRTRDVLEYEVFGKPLYEHGKDSLQALNRVISQVAYRKKERTDLSWVAPFVGMLSILTATVVYQGVELVLDKVEEKRRLSEVVQDLDVDCNKVITVSDLYNYKEISDYMVPPNLNVTKARKLRVILSYRTPGEKFSCDNEREPTCYYEVHPRALEKLAKNAPINVCEGRK